MSMEEVVPPNMMLAPRSYSTPPAWRLATYQEVTHNLHMIKQHCFSNEWQTARLLDGWISGPSHHFQMGDDFRSCLGYMLLIQLPHPSTTYNSDDGRSRYEDVPLTLKGREVALLLCSQDWNYEVLYWLLNFWETRHSFNPLDVTEGNLPFTNTTKFAEMNRLICHMGRILGEERPATETATRRNFSVESIKEVMDKLGKSCLDRLSQEHKIILGPIFLDTIHRLSKYVSEAEECFEVNWFQEFASQGDTSDAIWNFLWYIISSMTLLDTLRRILPLAYEEWMNEAYQTRSQRDFITSTLILDCLSDSVVREMWRTFREACKDAAGDGRRRFNDMLKNASFSSYTEAGNYDVLDKILIFAVRSEVSIVVKKVLEWGAQPQANLGPDRQNNALFYAILHGKEDIVRSLFDKCDSKEQFANAANEKGMTALHWTCDHRRENTSICRMIVEYGGRPDVGDNRGRLPLHYAVENGYEDILDVLIGEGNNNAVQREDFNERMAELVTWKDKDGVSPLDMAINKNNKKLMIKLLSVSEKAVETHIDKVGSAKLLREFASEGNIEVVKGLLERRADPRASDEQGQTALHHASFCEDNYKATKLVKLMLEKCTSEEDKKKWVSKQDDMGKTALHLATMKGHESLCYMLVNINEGLRTIKDKAGRIALFEAIEGGHYDLCQLLLAWRPQIPSDSIVDRSGQTALHVAASEGRMKIADLLLKESKEHRVYVRRADVFGQTALHKAAKAGHADVIKVLLHWGAHPLLERDFDGRTVFHYLATSPLTGVDGIEVAELLLKKCGSDERKLLLLWASAAGLGTADQILDESPLRKFLVEQKNERVGKETNLLKTAACLGDIDLTKELLTRGAHIGDIDDNTSWRRNLSKEGKDNVEIVRKQLRSIAEQGNDLPTTSDNLGRSDFAHGLAALLLNPYLLPPITVGISGSWGMGKSSLMVQTEGILLKTAAQFALLPSETSTFPGFKIFQHTEKGRNKYQQIERRIHLLLNDKPKKAHSLRNFLVKYEAKYHHIIQSLAAMDSSEMFEVEGGKSQLENDSSIEGSVPAILTVRYNAWKYKNESEALAGMAVEITKGMEGIMTDAQWLSTCLRNTWRQQKHVILIDVIFPCLLAILLATSFTWILWVVLDRYNIRESLQLKYASFPLTVVVMAWALAKKVMSTVNPVSAQLMNYIKLPDHTEKLGYQERVISDIKFLKKEISKKPYHLCSAASYIWNLITSSRIISLLSSKYSSKNISDWIPSGNLRTIVFVDDLDRCQESIILQVLSAVNLVLAVCEISVVLGMDKELIQRAIMKRHGDKSSKNRKLADKYLQKIIQLPLDLPDPSEVQSMNFLNGQLGVFRDQNPSKESRSKLEPDAGDDSIPEIERAYNDLFSPLYRTDPYRHIELLNQMLESRVTAISDSEEESRSGERREAPAEAQNGGESTIVDIGTRGRGAGETAEGVPPAGGSKGIYNMLKSKIGCICKFWQSKETQQDEGMEGTDGTSESKEGKDIIPIRELLLGRYSEGERDALSHFQIMATDERKLPRERKRFLTYHRLVWNIFIINKETNQLDGWQVQLITWIFICWEFEDNINILLQRWNEIDLLKSYKQEWRPKSESGFFKEPSLREIIEHCIEKEKWIIVSNKSEKIAMNSNVNDTTKFSNGSENKHPPAHQSEEDIREKIDTDSPVSLKAKNIERRELKEGDCSESSELEGTEKMTTHMKVKNDKLEKSLLMKLDALKKEIKEENKEIKEQLDCLRTEIKLLKEQVESQKSGKIEKRAEEMKLKSRSWWRLKSALESYDVTMGGIQAFQRFRFYCEAGHLQWPLPP